MGVISRGAALRVVDAQVGHPLAAVVLGFPKRWEGVFNTLITNKNYTFSKYYRYYIRLVLIVQGVPLGRPGGLVAPSGAARVGSVSSNPTLEKYMAVRGSGQTSRVGSGRAGSRKKCQRS